MCANITTLEYSTVWTLSFSEEIYPKIASVLWFSNRGGGEGEWERGGGRGDGEKESIHANTQKLQKSYSI